jgi:uncharacterized protein (TIGR03089 family)
MTLYDGAARVELSGATTANWVAKSANLLVDGLGGPGRIGLLLPLHWQTVALLLAGVASSATVVLATEPGGLAGCDVAFVLPEQAEAALDAGVADVLAVSGHPLGLRATGLPPVVLDYATEVPSYADHFGGPRPTRALIEAGGAPLELLRGVEAAGRVLTTLDPMEPVGAAVLVGALAAGASLVLLRSGDPQGVAAAEHVTATAGIPLQGLTTLA